MMARFIGSIFLTVSPLQSLYYLPTSEHRIELCPLVAGPIDPPPSPLYHPSNSQRSQMRVTTLAARNVFNRHNWWLVIERARATLCAHRSKNLHCQKPWSAVSSAALVRHGPWTTLPPREVIRAESWHRVVAISNSSNFPLLQELRHRQTTPFL